MAVVKVFMVAAMPFVVAEVVTGVVSHFTGELSIPLPFGVGTAVDLAILIGGLCLSTYWMLRKQPQDSEEAQVGRETMK